MLWTGHPWRGIRDRGGLLELSEETEESLSEMSQPPLTVAARIQRDDLHRAVAVADAECDRLAIRWAAALTAGSIPPVLPSGVSVEQAVAAFMGRA
jgi:hypothetical protein